MHQQMKFVEEAECFRCGSDSFYPIVSRTKRRIRLDSEVVHRGKPLVIDLKCTNCGLVIKYAKAEALYPGKVFKLRFEENEPRTEIPPFHV